MLLKNVSKIAKKNTNRITIFKEKQIKECGLATGRLLRKLVINKEIS